MLSAVVGRVCVPVVGSMCAGMTRPAVLLWDIGAGGGVGPPLPGVAMEGVCSRGGGGYPPGGREGLSLPGEWVELPGRGFADSGEACFALAK